MAQRIYAKRPPISGLVYYYNGKANSGYRYLVPTATPTYYTGFKNLAASFGSSSAGSDYTLTQSNVWSQGITTINKGTLLPFSNSTGMSPIDIPSSTTALSSASTILFSFTNYVPARQTYVNPESPNYTGMDGAVGSTFLTNDNTTTPQQFAVAKPALADTPTVTSKTMLATVTTAFGALTASAKISADTPAGLTSTGTATVTNGFTAMPASAKISADTPAGLTSTGTATVTTAFGALTASAKISADTPGQLTTIAHFQERHGFYSTANYIKAMIDNTGTGVTIIAGNNGTEVSASASFENPLNSSGYFDSTGYYLSPVIAVKLIPSSSSTINIQLYVDGILSAQSEASTKITSLGTGLIRLFDDRRDAKKFTRWFQGFMLYNRELSDTEIADLSKSLK